MGDVKTIDGTTPLGQPCLKTIAELEKLLERAKKGEIRSLAVAATLTDHHFFTTWEVEDSTAQLLGAVNHLAWRINDHLDKY